MKHYQFETLSIVNTAAEKRLVVGEKLENPYSVANMQKALATLQEDGMMKSSAVIEPTHLYVRFLPQNEEELDLIKKDTTLALFTYPLDHKVEGEGNYYHDPELKGKPYTYLYTVVPVGYTSPVSGYKVLDEVVHYFEDEEPERESGLHSKAASSDASSDWETILCKSMQITGNAMYEESEDNRLKGLFDFLKPKRYRARAKVMAWDDKKQDYVPVDKAYVRAQNFTHITKGYTDASGSTGDKLGLYIYAAKYSIIWETGEYDIREGAFNQAETNGNEVKGEYTFWIDGGKPWSLAFASIHRACWYMNTGYIFGINRPFIYSPVGGKTKLRYLHEKGKSMFNWNSAGVFANIDIRGLNKSGGRRLTHDLIETTIHELAHVGHCRDMIGIQYIQVSNILTESWAVAVQYYLTQYYYGDNITYDNYPGGIIPNDYQNWPEVNPAEPYYTCLFIDLIDNFNQRKRYGPLSSNMRYYADDDVTGYSLQTLNGILLESYGLASLSGKLKNRRPAGVTDDQIDRLIESIALYN
ncbi:MAG: hypothetical protein LBV41_06475 [Cytophagaceae bacterium]|jgi:hypothetical protein|nr:hypothetical protein [Cytophagaceae bacterium]